MYAEIIVDIAAEQVDRVFTYRVPDALKDQVRPGLACEVPFGQGNKVQRGFVLGLQEDTDLDKENARNWFLSRPEGLY